MANKLTSRIWELDTASADPIKGAGDESYVYTGGVAFYNYSANGDDCIFHDQEGNIVAHLKGNADLSPISWTFPVPQWIRGLTLTTLDSGKVQVTIF